jgi:hypothetical protein
MPILRKTNRNKSVPYLTHSSKKKPPLNIKSQQILIFDQKADICQKFTNFLDWLFGHPQGAFNILPKS